MGRWAIIQPTLAKHEGQAIVTYSLVVDAISESYPILLLLFDMLSSHDCNFLLVSLLPPASATALTCGNGGTSSGV